MMNNDETTEAQRSAQHERIIEILVYILDEMRKKHQLADIDINQLTARGFSTVEISTAFSWLIERIDSSELDMPLYAGDLLATSVSPKRAPTESIRVYHEVERMAIDKDAQGYLIQLRELGLVSDQEIEAIIDRVMMTGITPVTLSMVKELVVTLMFDFEDNPRLPGRQMLDQQDLIQ